MITQIFNSWPKMRTDTAKEVTVMASKFVKGTPYSWS